MTFYAEVTGTPLSSHDIMRFAHLYSSVVSRRKLHHCRSVPLEIFLSVMTAGQILVPLRRILDSVTGSEATTLRWIDVLASDKILSIQSKGSETFICLGEDYFAHFDSEI